MELSPNKISPEVMALVMAQGGVDELDGIGRNLSEQVLDGTYTIGEAIGEVMPFEYCLGVSQSAYVWAVVETLTGQTYEPWI